MKKTIRQKVFETNSSTCHCLTVIKQDELERLFHDQYGLVVHLPDTGEYCTDDKYEIMTIEEACNFWNSHVDEYNERYKNIDFHVDKYEHYWDFRQALVNGNLSQDEIFGKFLTYGELMSNVKPTGDVELNVMWENYS